LVATGVVSVETGETGAVLTEAAEDVGLGEGGVKDIESRRYRE
jgi:hypothetical protein